jgi:hypothetical protein
MSDSIRSVEKPVRLRVYGKEGRHPRMSGRSAAGAGRQPSADAKLKRAYAEVLRAPVPGRFEAHIDRLAEALQTHRRHLRRSLPERGYVARLPVT